MRTKRRRFKRRSKSSSFADGRLCVCISLRTSVCTSLSLYQRLIVMTEQQQGSFTVELQWLLASASPSEATAPENDENTQQVWAAVQLVDKSGQLLERFWFAADDDNTLTKSVQQPAGDDGSRDLTAVLFDYQQSSKTLPLTSDTLETLVNAQLQISVFTGATRSRVTDELLGEQQLPLMDVVLRHKLQQRIVIPTPALNQQIAIDVSVQADADLADFAMGCRVLRLHSLSILNLPKEWTLLCESDEDALRVCAAPDRNLATYELEIRLPKFTDSSGGDGTQSKGEALPFESVLVQGGKLQYEPSTTATMTTPAADDDSSSAGGDKDPVNPPPPSLTGTWSVAFPSSAGFTKLFLKVRACLD